jgi:cyclase
MQQISKNIYVDTEKRGADHGFVVTKKGVVLIDTPQYPKDAVEWRDTIKKFGPVKYIIHTEPHGDHWGGDYFFKGANIIAHEGTREEILKPGSGKWILENIKTQGKDSIPFMPEDFHFCVPDITLSERMTLYLGDHTFQMINHPGHTHAQIAVYIPEEKVCFTSDTIFHECMTFLQSALPFQWLESLQKLKEMDADVFVPGHGPVCDKSYLPQQTAIIRGWVEGMRKGMASGLTMEQLQNNPPYKDPYKLAYGVEFLEKELPRMNVACLYKVLKNNP